MTDRSNSPLFWLDHELSRLQQQGLSRQLSTRVGRQAVRSTLDSQELVNFGSNDYLALAADPKIVEAARQALVEEGWGSGASPLVGGRSYSHQHLEEHLSRFEATEASLLFTSGYAANASTIPTLVSRGDVIFGDEKNHASIIDGCRLSQAHVQIYKHTNCRHLEQLLESSDRFRRRLIVTDSLFSMDGDLAPLPELANLAKRFDAMLLVDEAHATGVFGKCGRGVAEHLGVESHIDIRVGTLSKALGSVGGFISGRRALIDWLANRARLYVFSTALPAAASRAALASLEIIHGQPQRRHQLLSRATDLRNDLKNQGWDVGHSTSQIIPLLVGLPDRAVNLSTALRARGLYVPAIRPPSVPQGQSLLRISLSYGHSPEMVANLLSTLNELRSDPLLKC